MLSISDTKKIFVTVAGKYYVYYVKRCKPSVTKSSLPPNVRNPLETINEIENFAICKSNGDPMRAIKRGCTRVTDWK